MKTLYIECKMGAAGDMLQGALYELLDFRQKQEYVEKMNALFPDAIAIHPLAGAQCGISGTKMQVLVHGQEERAGKDGHEDIHEHLHNIEPGHVHEHLHNHEQEPDHEHIHGQELCQEHSHDHFHEPEHSHDHFHEPEHSHDHTHEHEQDHDHFHEQEHDHDHFHEQEHGHVHSHAHYSYPEVCRRIHSLPLPEDVLSDAEAVYRMIGEAEAKAHNSTLEQIHFHEVGSLDAIADVAGVCLLVSILQPDQILVSPIHVGNGTVHCAHGILPVPAPATAEILKGVPYYTGEIMSELCTPTGAALLKHFADRFCPMPVMTIEKTGNGLGTKVFPIANMVRVFLGNTADSSGSEAGYSLMMESGHNSENAMPLCGDSDRILEISCNIDDMTGEELGYAMDTLLNAGALDVFYQPIYMKKNRPAVMLNCFCTPQEKDQFALLILKLTSTRGIRFQQYSRMKLESRFEECRTPWGIVHRKISCGYGITKSKYEYEDLKRIAREQGISPAEVRNMLESR